ncbi:hypothetical protein ACFW6F_32970 [Streptomyces sp. NPDC058746]|uniref:hypothetical protein n=1 Tax=Streptomyces sp. NPDC058746 TaxID=3346622 RepID=UPI0036B30B9C
MTFDFAAEWTEAKGEAAMRLASAGPSPAPTSQPSPSASPAPSPGNPNLGLLDGPVRSKASGIRTANAEARGKSALDDAEAVGRSHSGWVAGAASDGCVGAWQRRLRELADLVDDAADALTSSTNAITTEDQAIADRLRAAGGVLEDARWFPYRN